MLYARKIVLRRCVTNVDILRRAWNIGSGGEWGMRTWNLGKRGKEGDGSAFINHGKTYLISRHARKNM